MARCFETTAAPLALPLLLVSLWGCSSARATPLERPGGAQRSASFDQLLRDAEARLDQEVAFQAYVVPSGLGCLDMVCDNQSGCCGTCTADATLAATPDGSDGGERLFISADDPDRFDPEFGHCRDSEVCEMTCDPPRQTLLDVRGRLIRSLGFLAVVVTEARPAQSR